MTAKPVPVADDQFSRPSSASEHGGAPALSSAVMDSARATWAAETLRALGELDAIAHTALRLVYWNGLNLAQAADELSLSEAIVQRHVARGMRQLANQLTMSDSTIAPSSRMTDTVADYREYER